MANATVTRARRPSDSRRLRGAGAVRPLFRTASILPGRPGARSGAAPAVTTRRATLSILCPDAPGGAPGGGGAPPMQREPPGCSPRRVTTAAPICALSVTLRRMHRLLFIEDDDQIRLALRLALEDEGYVVEEAGDGRSGLAA